MLTISLTVGRTESGALAVPVADHGGSAVVLPVAALAADVRAEAQALASDPRLGSSGGAGQASARAGRIEHLARAGATWELPRPLRDPGWVLLAGVGAGDEAGWRAAGAAIARAARRRSSLTVALPSDADPSAVRGLAEGLWLAAYRFRAERTADPKPTAEPGSPGPADERGSPEPADERKSPEPADEQVLRRVELVADVDDPARLADALAVARVTAEAAILARDLTNTPSSRKNPAWFAERIQRAGADQPGLVVTVRDDRWLAEQGFGGVLAVGGGSASPPRLLEVRWRPPAAATHVVLVGKGITFDTGGVSIKPSDGMKLMRKDMAGAAAVVSTVLGAARLGLPVRLTALAPLAENMVSGSAYRPGDVIRHYDGTTSESTNTDAEGRLVLADAIGYAVRELRPDLLVDLATLTGANAVALGKRTAALYTDSDGLADAFTRAADAAGERVWRMPLPDDYVEYLDSDVADLYSAPTRGAGSVVAALYLREFVGELRDRWVHIDMSAPSWTETADGELARGATGWGARTLLRWLAELAGNGSATPDGAEQAVAGR